MVLCWIYLLTLSARFRRPRHCPAKAQLSRPPLHALCSWLAFWRPFRCIRHCRRARAYVAIPQEYPRWRASYLKWRHRAQVSQAAKLWRGVYIRWMLAVLGYHRGKGSEQGRRAERIERKKQKRDQRSSLEDRLAPSYLCGGHVRAFGFEICSLNFIYALRTFVARILFSWMPYIPGKVDKRTYDIEVNRLLLGNSLIFVDRNGDDLFGVVTQPVTVSLMIRRQHKIAVSAVLSFFVWMGSMPAVVLLGVPLPVWQMLSPRVSVQLIFVSLERNGCLTSIVCTCM